MKNTKTCPKCQATDVIHVPGNTSNVNSPHIRVAGVFNTYVPIGRYLCGKCGYLEMCVETDDDINRVRTNFR